MSLSSELLEEFSGEIGNWTLIPSGCGVFEITIDGELVFSKKALDRYPDAQEIRLEIKQAVAG